MAMAETMFMLRRSYGKEGLFSSDYDPNDEITKWYNEKVRNFKGAKLRKYPEKLHKLSNGNSTVNTAVSVCNSQSMKSLMELNSFFSKFFCYIYHLACYIT